MDDIYIMTEFDLNTSLILYLNMEYLYTFLIIMVFIQEHIIKGKLSIWKTFNRTSKTLYR